MSESALCSEEEIHVRPLDSIDRHPWWSLLACHSLRMQEAHHCASVEMNLFDPHLVTGIEVNKWMCERSGIWVLRDRKACHLKNSFCAL